MSLLEFAILAHLQLGMNLKANIDSLQTDNGLCVSEAVCNDYNGWYVGAGYCPNNPPGIDCCVDIPCYIPPDGWSLCETYHDCGGTLYP